MCHFAQFKDKRLRIGRSRLKYGDRPGEAFLHVVPGIDERNLGRALFLPEICRNGKSDRLSSAHASAKNKAAVKAAVLQDKEKIVFMGIKIKLLIKAISERTE